MGADLTCCRVYGVSAWGLNLEKAKQQNLVITRESESEITVDNIEVAQFVYLLLHNEKIRNVIDTIGRKGVLLLGRFTEGRIEVLQLLLLQDLGFQPETVAAGIATFDRALGRLMKPEDRWEPRQVLLFSGHMVDAPDRKEPRFPSEKEAAAAQAIEGALEHFKRTGPNSQPANPDRIAWTRRQTPNSQRGGGCGDGREKAMGRPPKLTKHHSTAGSRRDDHPKSRAPMPSVI
jgi:hypothetical protein